MIKWNFVLAGALAGLWKAADMDLKAWSEAESLQGEKLKFEFLTALRRWIYGALAGAAAGAGIGEVVHG